MNQLSIPFIILFYESYYYYKPFYEVCYIFDVVANFTHTIVTYSSRCNTNERNIIIFSKNTTSSKINEKIIGNTVAR